jgi:hypothetical protein
VVLAAARPASGKAGVRRQRMHLTVAADNDLDTLERRSYHRPKGKNYPFVSYRAAVRALERVRPPQQQ